jgi:uncharacterized protein (TIGR00255 family)
MTGFASKTIEVKNKEGVSAYVTANLKSLNTRYFEAICKLPYPLQSIEVDIITQLKRSLSRGKITLNIHSSNPNIFKGPVETSVPTIKSYIHAINEIKKECAIKGELSLTDIITLPDVLVTQDVMADDAIKKEILAAIDEVIKELIVIRRNEGAQLYADIKQRYSHLQDLIEKISKASEKIHAEKKKEIEAELADLNHQQSELVEIRRNEISNALDKLDIHEEIVRFNSHLKSLANTLDDAVQEKGRRVDFIVQELNREINTIAAKCSDAQISSLAISAKIELEKIREQAQNIV